MTKHDTLQRFLFENMPVRGELVQLQDSVQEILRQQDYPAPVKKVLAEALCAAVLLTAVIKYEGRVTVQFRGKGGLSLLLAQSNNKFEIRGLAKYDETIQSDEDVIKSFQDGVLAIMLDSGSKHNQYQGVVNWCGNSLSESLEGYFRDSEQLVTRIWLASDKQSAAGFLLQVMPGEEQVEEGGSRELVNNAHLEPADILNTESETVLKTHFSEYDIRVFSPADIIFKCTCSREKGENAILILGRKEAEEEIKDKNAIAVTCEFCNEEFLFDRVDVAGIFEKNENLPPNINLH